MDVNQPEPIKVGEERKLEKEEHKTFGEDEEEIEEVERRDKADGRNVEMGKADPKVMEGLQRWKNEDWPKHGWHNPRRC